MECWRRPLESPILSGISLLAMMSRKIVGTLGILSLAATLGYGALRQQATKTADGVYTSQQADRGMQIIEDYGCRNCHGSQLEGGADEQPQLIGDEFVGTWTGRKLDELAEKITMMPADADPQYQVKPAAAPDVIAFLLRANGYRAGTAALSSDPNVLKRIEINAP